MSASENPVGVWVANYVSKQVAVGNANVQGMRIGVARLPERAPDKSCC